MYWWNPAEDMCITEIHLFPIGSSLLHHHE